MTAIHSDSASLSRAVNIDGVIEGSARLTQEQALRLYHEASLTDLGQWATAVANRKMRERYPDLAGRFGASGGAGIRTYVIDRNINYTNVCSANCTFCAFKRDPGDRDAYTLNTEQLHKKIAELVAIGGTQVLLQGGMHPELPIEWYEEMLRGIKRAFPMVHVHGFSPPEIVEFVAVFKLDGFPATKPGHSDELGEGVWNAKLDAILERLRAAGLDSVPGGGGEIFAENIRRRIGLGKATAKQWLAVMSAAHRKGMHTSATMMFGHIEGVADRIDHMARVRAAQDLAIQNDWPGRYVAFIAWPFQRENTPLGRLKNWEDTEGKPASGSASSTPDPSGRALVSSSAPPFPGDIVSESIGGGHGTHDLAYKRLRMAGATDYLRTQAVSRLFLDNVHSIGSSWVTMGPKIGQLALYFGATDMGSVMMEENVVSAAGTTYCLNEPVLCHLIRNAGFVPAQRDNRYDLLKIHEGENAPDLKVEDWSKHRAKKLHQEHAHDHAGEEPQTIALMIRAEKK